MAGLKVAPARLVGHCVTQVFYDGAWHLFDGDMHSLYLLRDNVTIAGEQDVVRDHDLIKRTHTQGILRPQGRAGDARTLLAKLLQEERKTGNKGRLATRLLNLSLARTLQGDLVEAEALTAEECALNEALGAKANLASCRTRRALLWIGLGRGDDARAAVGLG